MSTLRVNNMTNIGGTGPTYAPGHIIQVVQGSYATSVSSSSTSYNDSGLTATITPKSANSKILVIANQAIQPVSLSNSYTVAAQILRDSTGINEITLSSNAALGAGGALAIHTTVPLVQLDSPATTSAITYKVQGKLVSGFRVDYQVSNAKSTITLIEVAA